MCAYFVQWHQVRGLTCVLNCVLFLSCVPNMLLLDNPMWKRKWSEKGNVLSIETVDLNDSKFQKGN